MFEDRIEAKWIDSFVRVFEYSKVQAGDDVAILSETQSRNLKLQLCELALLRIGARPYHLMLPTPPQEFSMPVRSNGPHDLPPEHSSRSRVAGQFLAGGRQHGLRVSSTPTNSAKFSSTARVCCM